jgi:branched-chain amino acid transport system ATP-binding protein
MKKGKYKKKEGNWTIDKVYKKFPHLSARIGTPGGKLSGGEQQMLTIMRTLIGNPDLILIDEPSEGLSPIMAQVVFDIISEIHREGLTVILVDQNLPYACAMAERVYIMSKGRIAYTGTGKEVKESKEIQAKFLAV